MRRVLSATFVRLIASVALARMARSCGQTSADYAIRFAALRAISYGPGFARCPGTRDRIAERNRVKKFQSRASCLIARFNGRQASITAALAQPRALTALV